MQLLSVYGFAGGTHRRIRKLVAKWLVLPRIPSHGLPSPSRLLHAVRQLITSALGEVEAPVHLVPHQAQPGAQEDRVPSQKAAVQVRDGLKGVGATHLQARAPPGELVL